MALILYEANFREHIAGNRNFEEIVYKQSKKKMIEIQTISVCQFNSISIIFWKLLVVGVKHYGVIHK